MFSSTFTSASPFCKSGTSTAMYMSGIRSTFLSDGESTPCLNVLFPRWTLDTRIKFVLAMVGLLSLAMLAEFLSALRHRGRLLPRDGRVRRRRWARRAVTVSAHVCQVAIGYVLMFAAMTYSLELVASILLGLGIGYGVFFSEDDMDDEEEALEELGQVVPAYPCCDFIPGRRRMRRRASARRRGSQSSTIAEAVAEENNMTAPLLSSGHILSDNNDGEAEKDGACCCENEAI